MWALRPPGWRMAVLLRGLAMVALTHLGQSCPRHAIGRITIQDGEYGGRTNEKMYATARSEYEVGRMNGKIYSTTRSAHEGARTHGKIHSSSRRPYEATFGPRLRLSGSLGDSSVSTESDRCRGRVEVLYGGTWGTVCDDGWDLLAAGVACAWLGCGEALAAPGAAHFGRGRGPVHLDNVRCEGDESALWECAHAGWGDHNCGHHEDAGIVCQGECCRVTLLSGAQVGATAPGGPLGWRGAFPTTTMRPTVQPVSEFPKGLKLLRLAWGSEPGLRPPPRCQGRVEVLYESEWGTVCDDEWDMLEAGVACVWLGCGEALAAPGAAHFGRGRGPVHLDNVHCRGDESALWDCEHAGWGDHNCGHHEDAGIVCQGAFLTTLAPTTPTQPPTMSSSIHDSSNVTSANGSDATAEVTPSTSLHNQDVPTRLVGGASPCEGRVELSVAEGQWATVCDDVWDLADARVACRSVGCGPALAAPGSAVFGRGRGPIALDNVECVGTEANLGHCAHAGWGVHNCGHGEDAGAVCAGPGSDTTYASPLELSSAGTARFSWVDTPPSLLPLMRLVGEVEPSPNNSTRLPPLPPMLSSTNVRRCQGRIELFLMGTWGTVCDDAWDLTAASVACAALGCGAAVAAPGLAAFGPGRGPIWLDNVKCEGHEASLVQCSHIGAYAHNCDHTEDAGVVCAGPG
ncbi:scavenger receptor cysteine-rich domain-containing group B protein-like [Petromyzon marinus]|uniref:scavenger receptor cysteine-rich domain-containing group B protein-like n=1 Tax=Petromyzon marinus TaxID=7757 RepID=UPI003F6FF5C5